MPDMLETKAMDIQEKFELYAISLTFTILGLSIHTAEFGNCPASDLFELLGWLLLILSGVIGLQRMAAVPALLRSYSLRQRGGAVSKDAILKLEKKTSSRLFYWLMVAGIVSVVLARALHPLYILINYY